MASGKHLGLPISIRITPEEKEALSEWARREHRTVTNLVVTLVREGLRLKRIGAIEDIEQIGEFIRLLLGERERDNLSLVEVGEILGINPDKLADLYLFIEECRDKSRV